MTWEEVQKATLGKMFATEDGAADLTDSRNADYVAMMPNAVNEALNYIANLLPLRRSVELELEYSPKPTYLVAADVCPDYKSLGRQAEAYLLDDEGAMSTIDVTAYGSKYLMLPAQREGTVMLYYDAWPQVFTSTTENDTVIELQPDLVVLLPLYMASQILKEDDMRIATQYRNEFEAALESVTMMQGVQSLEFTDTSGWIG